MPQECSSCSHLQRDVSQFAVDSAVLKVQVSALTKTCEGLEETVTQLNNTLNQSKGGWFVLSSVASLGALAASAVFSLIQYFTK